MTVERIEPDYDGGGLRIGIVQSRFNEALCDVLRRTCIDELLALGVLAEDILVASVPGALEIPLALQRMAQSEQFDALVALGAVIRGETYHFELVANESAAGIARLALRYAIPIANAILTTDTESQAAARSAIKGAEAARVAVEMANLSSALGELGEDAESGDESDLD